MEKKNDFLSNTKINKKIIEKEDIKTTNISSISENNLIKLKEVKKLCSYYKITKKDLIKYYLKLKKTSFTFIENLILILESKLDTILFNLNFTNSINQSQQYIQHNHVLVNNKIIKFTHFLCQQNDKISINLKNKNVVYNIQNNLKINKNIILSPIFLQNYDLLEATFYPNLLNFENIFEKLNIDFNKIIEYCSSKKK
jgi:ribosomal protein S4